MAAFHQSDEVGAGGRRVRIDAEPGKRVLVGKPTAGRLRHLPVRCQIVVAALGRDRLALQVARVPAALAGGDAGRGHHACTDHQRAEPAIQLDSRHPLVHLVCPEVGATRGWGSAAAFARAWWGEGSVFRSRTVERESTPVRTGSLPVGAIQCAGRGELVGRSGALSSIPL
jgi:hypothetical protein